MGYKIAVTLLSTQLIHPIRNMVPSRIILSITALAARPTDIHSFSQCRTNIQNSLKHSLSNHQKVQRSKTLITSSLSSSSSSINLHHSPLDIAIDSITLNDYISPSSQPTIDAITTSTTTHSLISSSSFLINDSNIIGGELSNQNIQDIVIFIIGVIPFIWATIEFFRRVSLGLPFGTGSDSVTIFIGEDDNVESSRGRRVLGKGALVIAILLFGIASASIGIAVYSVITSAPPPPTQL